MKKDSSLTTICNHFSHRLETYDSQAIVQNLIRSHLIKLTIPWLYNNFFSLSSQNNPHTLNLKFADLGAGGNLNFTRDLWNEFSHLLNDENKLSHSLNIENVLIDIKKDNILINNLSNNVEENSFIVKSCYLANCNKISITGDMIDIVDTQKSTELLQEDLKQHFPLIKLRSQIASLDEWVTIPQQHKYDLIISCSCFQWLSNPQHFFKLLKNNILNKNGTIICSTFSVLNFQELRALGLPGLHYYTPNEWQNIFEDAGFKIDFLYQSKSTLYFPILKNLFQHLKETGVNGIGSQRNWNKENYQQFLSQYHELFYTMGKGYPLTYHPVIIIAHT